MSIHHISLSFSFCLVSQGNKAKYRIQIFVYCIYHRYIYISRYIYIYMYINFIDMTYDICKKFYIHQMLLTYRFLIVMVCFLCFGPPSFRHPSHTNCRFGRSLSRLRSQHDRQFRRDAKRVIKQNSKKKTSSLDYRASYKWIQWADLKPVLDSLMTH